MYEFYIPTKINKNLYFEYSLRDIDSSVAAMVILINLKKIRS